MINEESLLVKIDEALRKDANAFHMWLCALIRPMNLCISIELYRLLLAAELGTVR